MQHGYTSYMIYLMNKLRHAAEVKWVAGLLVSVFSFLFDPVQYLAMLAVFVLICMDFSFGVAAARYTGIPIRSSKIVRTAIKMVVYFVLISAARVTEHALPFGFLDETVTGFLAATELLSILENTGRLGFAVPQKVVDLLGDFISGKNKDKRKEYEKHTKHLK